MGSRSIEQLQIRERIAVGIFPDFRDHKSIDVSEGCDLAIDMEHLRLEKISAIAGYDRFQGEEPQADFTTEAQSSRRRNQN